MHARDKGKGDMCLWYVCVCGGGGVVGRKKSGKTGKV